MKQFLRIFIVIILMVGIGFGTYALFFKPANEEEVYLLLSGIEEIDKKHTYDKKLGTIGKANFDPSAELQEGEIEYTQKAKYISAVESYGKYLEVGADDVILSAGNKQYAFPELKEKLDAVFNYYFAYSQAVTKKISKSELKKVKVALANYEDSMEELTNSIGSLEGLQGYIKKNRTENYADELANRYKVVIIKFRDFINKYATLIDTTRAFVTEYVFEGEMIQDKDSLMYDLMIKSLIRATSVPYTFDDAKVKSQCDDYMTSSTQIIALATSWDKDAILETTYCVGAGSIIYDGDVYDKKVVSLNIFEVDLKLESNGDNHTLKLGGVVVAKSGSAIKSINDNIITLKLKNSAGGDELKEFVIVDNKVPMKLYVDGVNTKNLYVYDKDLDKEINGVVTNHGYFLQKNMHFVLENEYQVTGSQVKFGESNSTFASSKMFVEYYDILGDYCKVVSADGIQKVVKIDASGDIDFTTANYCSKNKYNTDALGEKLNYKQMVKSYNRIVDNSPDNIAKILELSTQNKVAFVKDEPVAGASIRTGFVETIHYDIEYLLAGLGFIGEV